MQSSIILAALVFPAQAVAESPEVQAYPVLMGAFGGGAYSKQRIGVLGGDVLGGAQVLIGSPAHDHAFLLMATGGWSGWGTLGRERLFANTFTGRLDLGYENLAFQSVTVFGAGRIGTGRDLDCDCEPFRLYGAQAGVAYSPLPPYFSLELQSNWNNYRGEWNHDLRFVVSVNLFEVFGLLISEVMPTM